MESLDYCVLNQEDELLFTTARGPQDMAALGRCEQRQQRQHWHHKTHVARAVCNPCAFVTMHPTHLLLLLPPRSGLSGRTFCLQTQRL